MAYFLLRNSKFMILEPRLDRNNRARRILLYVRKKMITKLLSRHSFPHDIELLLIEWRLRKEKWQISCCYNRHENLISYHHHLEELAKWIQMCSNNYDDILLISDFNEEVSETSRSSWHYLPVNLLQKP